MLSRRTSPDVEGCNALRAFRGRCLHLIGANSEKFSAGVVRQKLASAAAYLAAGTVNLVAPQWEETPCNKNVRSPGNALIKRRLLAYNR